MPSDLVTKGLTRMLVDDARVAVSDGASFGVEGTGMVRLNIGVPRSILNTGLNNIREAVNKLPR